MIDRWTRCSTGWRERGVVVSQRGGGGVGGRVRGRKREGRGVNVERGGEREMGKRYGERERE